MLFFLSRAPAHHSFTFDLQFLYELKHKVYLSETMCGIFHFRFHCVFIKVYIFVQQKAQTLLNIKHRNSFQNKNNRKATCSFASKHLIYNLQQDVLKFNDIFVSWSSPKLTWRQNFQTWKIQVLSLPLFSIATSK